MSDKSIEFSARLNGACTSLGLTPDMVQHEKLLKYISQLQRWNKTYNLTAVRDPEQMLVQHIFDSLSVVLPIQQELAEKNKSSARIMDVGSGAGLPGVVLAIVNPEWEVVCVDAVEKKMAFVRQMSAVLALPNLKATHQRVETITPYAADIVISRAFASLVDFVTLAGQHISQNGRMLAMKGRQPENEILELTQQTSWSVDHVKPLRVPELDAQRCLVYLSQQG